MKRRALQLCGVVASLGSLALSACGGPGYATEEPQPRFSQHYLRATVQAVYVESRALDCQSGVGYAIEIVRIRVPPDARIVADDRNLTLADLRRGDVVEVRHRETPAGLVAERIERIELEGRGRER